MMSITSALLPILMCTAAMGQSCSDGWTRMLGQCYLLIEEKMTFKEAHSTCISMGAQVPTIKSRLQNEHLTDLLYNKWAKNVDVWLGARRVHSFGTNATDFWVWTDFTEIRYFNWAPSQPNLNGPQYCIEMVREHKVYYQWPAGTWNDINCNEVNAVLCIASGPVPPNGQSCQPSSDDDELPRIAPLLKTSLSLLFIIMIFCIVLFIYRNYHLNLKFRFERPNPDFGFRIDRNKNVSSDKLNFTNSSLNSPIFSEC